MKKNAILCTIGVAATLTVCASSTAQASSLDNQIRKVTAKFEAMQRNPRECVPSDLLRNARGIILLDRTKAGFGFAFEGGSGIAMVKDARGNWSPPAFLRSSEASLGPQFGGEQNFFVILLMTTNETRELTGSVVDFGGVAQGTAGDQSAGVENLAVPKDSGLVYGDRKGFYGGVAMKGGTLSPDNRANATYYGHYVTMRDILFDRKVHPTEAATDLAHTLSNYSQTYGTVDTR